MKLKEYIRQWFNKFGETENWTPRERSDLICFRDEADSILRMFSRSNKTVAADFNKSLKAVGIRRFQYLISLEPEIGFVFFCLFREKFVSFFGEGFQNLEEKIMWGRAFSGKDPCIPDQRIYWIKVFKDRNIIPWAVEVDVETKKVRHETEEEAEKRTAKDAYEELKNLKNNWPKAYICVVEWLGNDAIRIAKLAKEGEKDGE